MRLIAYRTAPVVPEIRPASPRRGWMDETSNKFAYRCLPLTMASQFGWELLSPCTFDALWTGGKGPGAVQVVHLGGRGQLPETHFGHGILTFHPCHLFRTESPYDLFVGGPINLRKDGIQPLTGLVETDWLPFTFSMNWAFTRPGVVVRFEEGEPFCQFFPVVTSTVESVRPELRDLSSEPELERQYREWRDLRNQWNADMQVEGTQAHEEGWQRFYLRGTNHEGVPAPRHQTRLRLCPFRETAEAGTPHPAVPGRAREPVAP